MYTVVIVEDDPLITELNLRYTEQDGRFAVACTFALPRRALEWLRHNSADLVILDFYMPQMNGLEFLQAVRAAGLSVVTVRRYLAYLAQQGQVAGDMNYGTGGRPCLVYRLNL